MSATPHLPDFYLAIHKGVRAMLADLLARASTLSWSRPVEVAALRVAVDDTFELLLSHADTEDRFVHPLLAVAAPEVLDRLARAHDEQDQVLGGLHDLLCAIEAGEGAALGHRFVLALSRYVAEQLAHMADEEQRAQPALWERVDPQALHAAHVALLASIPPGKMQRYMRWILPALSAEEREGMLLGMQQSAPPPAFAGMLALCREVLAPAQLQRLPAQLLAA